MAARASYSSWWARAPGRWIQTPFAVWSRSAHSGGGGRPRSSSPSPLLSGCSNRRMPIHGTQRTSLTLEPTVPGEPPSWADGAWRQPCKRRGSPSQGSHFGCRQLVYRSPSSTTLASLRCMLALVVGGLARSASSRSDIAGCRRRSRAASCNGPDSDSSAPDDRSPRAASS